MTSGTHVAVLEKAAPQIDLFMAKPAKLSVENSNSGNLGYAELATKLFGASTRRVVAFACVSHGEGVTRTIRGVARELVRTGRTVATLDGDFHRLPQAGSSVPTPESPSEPVVLSLTRPSNADSGGSAFTSFRNRYDAVLLDCGAIGTSADLLRLAPHSDGVVLVIEAGRTTKEQVEHAIRVVNEAQSVVIGGVLNKRRYPVPGWLYHRL